MSSIYRELIAVFRGTDELTPVINHINGSLTNAARISQATTSQMAQQGGMLTRQWEKFRTTFGYAVSGMATYKVIQAFQNLSMYNQELGQINAMLPNLGSGLSQLGDIALRVSTQTGQPLQDVLGSIQNIIQSMPNMSAAARKELVPAMAQIEAMGSKIMGIDPRSFGSVVLSMTRAFYGAQRAANPQAGPKLLSQVAGQLYQTYKTTPRLTGQELTQYLPLLQTGAVSAGFSFPEMLALFTTVQRSFGRASLSATYTRQLLMRLRKPTKAEQPFFAQAGLSPMGNMVNMSGMQILQQLMQYGLGLPGGMTPEQIQQAVKTGNWRTFNIKGQAATFFQQAIGGRMQSSAALSALVRNLGQLTLQQNQLQQIANSGDALKKEFDRFNQQNSLQRMSNAMTNATTDLLQNFMPGLSVGASSLTTMASDLQTFSGHLRSWDRNVNQFVLGHIVSQKFAQQHNIVGGALDVGLTTAGILALMKSPRGIASVLRRIPGRLGKRIAIGEGMERGVGARAMGAIAAAETPQAAVNALAGVATGSPSAPFWVVIHPLSMSTVPSLFGKGGAATTAGGVENKIKQGLWNKIKGPITGVLGGAVGRYGLRAAGADATAIASGVGLAYLGSKTISGFISPIKHPHGDKITSARDWLYAIEHPGYDAKKIGSDFRQSYDDLNKAGDAVAGFVSGLFGGGGHHTQQTQKLRRLSSKHVAQLGKLTGQRIDPGFVAPLYTQGSIDATFTLVPSKDFKGLLEPQKVRAKVPVTLWNKSSSPPTERGKAKVSRNRGD